MCVHTTHVHVCARATRVRIAHIVMCVHVHICTCMPCTQHMCMPHTYMSHVCTPHICTHPHVCPYMCACTYHSACVLVCVHMHISHICPTRVAHMYIHVYTLTTHACVPRVHAHTHTSMYTLKTFWKTPPAHTHPRPSPQPSSHSSSEALLFLSHPGALRPLLRPWNPPSVEDGHRWSLTPRPPPNTPLKGNSRVLRHITLRYIN